MADWAAMKMEYITTDTSYRKLAEKYGVSRVQVGNVGREEGWVELRRQHLDNIVTKTVEATEQQEINRTMRILAVSDKLLDKIEAIVDTVGTDTTAKAIRALTAAVKDLREIQGIKSELDSEEQRARIANLRRQAEKEDVSGSEVIEVVFAAGPEEWNE